MMAEYTFTLIIQGDVDGHLDELFEAGCGDATFGSVDGIPYAEFDRIAPTMLQAVSSAINAIETISGLQVIRIEPDDLVTASEIAQRLGRSRESVRLLISGARGPGGFPAPISHLRARHRLWHWSEIAIWAKQDEPSKRQEAQLLAATNAVLDLRGQRARLTHDERAFVDQLAQTTKAAIPLQWK